MHLFPLYSSSLQLYPKKAVESGSGTVGDVTDYKVLLIYRGSRFSFEVFTELLKHKSQSTLTHETRAGNKLQPQTQRIRLKSTLQPWRTLRCWGEARQILRTNNV